LQAGGSQVDRKFIKIKVRVSKNDKKGTNLFATRKNTNVDFKNVFFDF